MYFVTPPYTTHPYVNNSEGFSMIKLMHRWGASQRQLVRWQTPAAATADEIEHDHLRAFETSCLVNTDSSSQTPQ